MAMGIRARYMLRTFPPFWVLSHFTECFYYSKGTNKKFSVTVQPDGCDIVTFPMFPCMKLKTPKQKKRWVSLLQAFIVHVFEIYQYYIQPRGFKKHLKEFLVIKHTGIFFQCLYIPSLIAFNGSKLSLYIHPSVSWSKLNNQQALFCLFFTYFTSSSVKCSKNSSRWICPYR